MVPYFIFVRDMAVYLVLLGLHVAICFENSQLSFSGLEWAILVLLLGRLFTEIKQVADMEQKGNYFRYINLLLCLTTFISFPIAIKTMSLFCLARGFLTCVNICCSTCSTIVVSCFIGSQAFA